MMIVIMMMAEDGGGASTHLRGLGVITVTQTITNREFLSLLLLRCSDGCRGNAMTFMMILLSTRSPL